MIKDFDKMFEGFDKVFNKIDDIMASININGKEYGGTSIIVRNNKITVNGVDVTPDSKQVNIVVTGDIDTLNADYCDKITVNGNAKEVQATSGDIECRDVQGDVRTTSGDVECGNVGGSIQTVSGDVKAENINGNVKTVSGDIKHRK